MLVVQYLAANPPVLLVLTGLLGLLVGSFLNVVIHRVPKMMEREWRGQCAELLETQPPADQQQPYNIVVPRAIWSSGAGAPRADGRYRCAIPASSS